MSVVRRVNLIFNKWTRGGGGRDTEYQPPDTLLEGFCGVFCVLFVVFSVLKGYRTQHQLLLAIPSVSPIPPSRLTPLCPFWLDNTQALYATCPSARLYLGEPRSLGLELPLLGFWPCPPPPPFPLLCVSLSLLLVSFRSLLSFTNTDSNSGCLCPLLHPSECMHRRRPWTPTSPSCHLRSGHQVPGRLKLDRNGWNQPPSLGLTCTCIRSKHYGLLPSQIGLFFWAFISANIHKLKASLLFSHVFSYRCSFLCLSLPRIPPHTSSICASSPSPSSSSSEAVTRAVRPVCSLWNKEGKQTSIPAAPAAFIACCLSEKGHICGCRGHKQR